jgi:hypothetical protein
MGALAWLLWQRRSRRPEDDYPGAPVEAAE